MEPRAGGNGRGALRESLLHGANVTAMLPAVHKQGYLGDLHEKSEAELMDLLERQEKLLQNRKFIDRLPDKGEKIRNFAKTLQDVLVGKQMDKSITMKSEGKDSAVEESQSRGDEDKMEEDSTGQIAMKHQEELKIIERGFGQLSVHEGPHYQVVVKAEERAHGKSKFSLNRPQKSATKEQTPSKPESRNSNQSAAELTSASVHDPEHGPATLISVQECRTLYSTQQRKLQESRAEQLADRMMKRFDPGGVYEHPEGRHRTKEVENSDGELLDPDQDYLDSVD